jgi:glycosyltransferase involved in cell wall biosynthesis
MQLGLALEYSLGHVTHAQNLQQQLEGVSSVMPHAIRLAYDDNAQWWQRLPGIRSNWSLRASIGARLFLKRHQTKLQGLFFHSQVTSLLSADLMRSIPSVVSLDATPLQYDALGASYSHATGPAAIETFKKNLNTRTFTTASRLVTWSEWAKGSLVNDYGIDAEKVVVIPPGIDTERWNFGVRPLDTHTHLLFVGGDFYRKGGQTLLDAWRGLSQISRRHATLHIVTKTEGITGDMDGIQLHYGLTPNSDALIDLYRIAGAFVFPSIGDCLPLAVLEALASGLPVLTTNVAALPEAVRHMEAGLILPMDDVAAWTAALADVIADASLRRAWGEAARQHAIEKFDARKNYGRLVNVITQCAERKLAA